MTNARIYKPSQSAMQSARGKTQKWVLELESNADRAPEPLMGWTQSEDTLAQIRMKFESLDDAKAYAEQKGITYKVQPDRARTIKPRNYGDNFKYVPPEEKA